MQNLYDKLNAHNILSALLWAWSLKRDVWKISFTLFDMSAHIHLVVIQTLVSEIPRL